MSFRPSFIHLSRMGLGGGEEETRSSRRRQRLSSPSCHLRHLNLPPTKAKTDSTVSLSRTGMGKFVEMVSALASSSPFDLDLTRILSSLLGSRGRRSSMRFSVEPVTFSEILESGECLRPYFGDEEGNSS